ncbi:hypothetical protein Q1695_007906 [Nippostrongylus brasiliensis]|nr:hypothetical protein Q1695_007906 [Nippostrongylus brasiliensis]
MATRLAHTIVDALQNKVALSTVYIFADSETALNWVQSSSKDTSAGIYVNNRKKEIHHISKNLRVSIKFGYVNTSTDPADCGTRGLVKDELTQHYWWSGPEFISKPQEEWQKDCKVFTLQEEHENCFLTAIRTSHTQSELVDWKRQKSLSACQNSMAYVLRFVKGIVSKSKANLRKRVERAIPEILQMTSLPYVTATEREMALNVIIKNHQRIHLSESTKTILKQLKLVIDKNSILRCRGRLDETELTYDARQPIIIEAKTKLATLIVQEAHTELHCSVAHTMANVRQKYCIPKLRQLTRTVIRACVACQKIKNLPFAYPEMSYLPGCRVQKTRPFQNVRMDFFGPIVAKESGSTEKFYGIIFTCATTRLLHLELAGDMSTTAVLLALRKFFARRGVPAMIISDNAPSFLLADDILKEAAASISSAVTIAKTMATRGIVWKTITPYAPWQGAFYERLIKSIKESLYKVTHSHVLERENLEALLVEIEGSLNTRPLTYQEINWEDSPILRPIDFIQRGMIVTYPLEYVREQEDEEYLPREEMIRLHTRRQAEEALRSSRRFTEKFWSIWSNEYITSLREKHELSLKGKKGGSTLPRPGKVVLLADPILPRNTWKVGRITHLKESKDGEIREAEVKMPNGRLIRRFVNLLVPLEIGDEEEKANDHENLATEKKSDQTSTAVDQTLTKRKCDCSGAF